jgi:hypothetical protein
MVFADKKLLADSETGDEIKCQVLPLMSRLTVTFPDADPCTINEPDDSMVKVPVTVRLLQSAEVDAPMTAVLPEGMITSVPATGTLPPPQLVAVFQSVPGPIKVPGVTVVKLVAVP